MSQRLQENLIAGALLAIFTVYIFMSLQFGPNARLVPLPMAILGFFLVAAQILKLNVGSAGDSGLDSNTLEAITDESAPVSSEEPGSNAYRELQAFGCIAAFVALIAVLGPVIAVFLFSGGYLFFTQHASPGKALMTASLFTAIIYVLFVVGLQLQLYHGILEPIFGQY
jgi:hypothetical protein